MEKPCPKCGYCPCCGRSAQPLHVEWPGYPQYPWWQSPSPGWPLPGSPYAYRYVHSLNNNAVTIAVGSN